MVTIAWEDGKVRFLDQTLLPLEEQYVVTGDYRVVGEGIRALQIRGAPAIGIAGAFAAALAVHDPACSTLSEMRAGLDAALRFLERTRPTAVNLFMALERMRSISRRPEIPNPEAFREAILQEALNVQKEDVAACASLAAFGSALIAPGSSLLTHCNTGALATSGGGTALGVILQAHRQGKVKRVYVDETRPLLQGARLTAWELLHEGVETVLLIDSAAASVLQRGLVQAVLVGADRIAANGDTANKVGTYPLAVLASRHQIPLYVVAPTSSIDFRAPSGDAIPIEERDASEVTHWHGARIAPEGVEVFAPAFDVTPNELISAIVTERGVVTRPYGSSLLTLAGGTAR